MRFRKPVGISLIALAGVAIAVGSCATTRNRLAAVSPPPADSSTTQAAPAVAPVPPSPTPPKPAAKQLAGSTGLHTNEAGRAIIKESEGLHLSAYNNGGQWLIGYGHAKGVKSGMTISAAQAERYLKQDLAACEASIADVVSAPITQNEFSAMAALCYNIGTGKFANSTLVKKLNAGEEMAAADAFLDWSKATVNGKRVVLPPLLERRQKERALFLDGIEAPRA